MILAIWNQARGFEQGRRGHLTETDKHSGKITHLAVRKEQFWRPGLLRPRRPLEGAKPLRFSVDEGRFKSYLGCRTD